MSTRQKPNPDPGIINYLATNVEQQADPMTKRAHMAVLLRFLSFFTKFEGKVSDPIKLYEEKLGELEHQRGGSNATPRGSTSGSDEELMQVKSVLETLKKTLTTKTSLSEIEDKILTAAGINWASDPLITNTSFRSILETTYPLKPGSHLRVCFNAARHEALRVLNLVVGENEASARMRIQPWLINAVANLLPLDEDMEDDEEDPIGDDPVVPVLSGGIELPDRLFIVPEMAVAYQELDLDDGRKALVRGAIDWVTVRIPGNKASFLKLNPALALEDKTFDREICIIEAKAAEINTRAVLTQALAEAAIVCEYQNVNDVRGCITNGIKWLFFVYIRERKRAYLLPDPVELVIQKREEKRYRYRPSKSSAAMLFRILVDWVCRPSDSSPTWYSVPEAVPE